MAASSFLSNIHFTLVIGLFSLHQCTSTLTTVENQMILDLHNDARNHVAGGRFISTLTGGVLPFASNMNELLWDPSLAELANQCTSHSAHSIHTTDDLNSENSTFQMPSIPEPLGLNSQIYSQNTLQFTDVIKSWISEGHYYDYHTQQCNASTILQTNTCEQFTQIVWSNTRYIGCGIPMCNETDISTQFPEFVCHYYPSVQTEITTPYTAGLPCTDCDGDRDILCDENSLCGGGVSSSFVINGLTNIDRCSNGLGVLISNACLATTAYFTTTAHPTKSPISVIKPKKCKTECDTFSVTVENSVATQDDVCLTYRVSRLFERGLCKKSAKYMVLALCGDDGKDGKCKSNDLNGLIESFEVINGTDLSYYSESSERSDSSEHDIDAWATHRQITGIRINVKIDNGMIFELCLKNVFVSPFQFSNTVKFKKGDREYICDEIHLKGLPCLDETKYKKYINRDRNNKSTDNENQSIEIELTENEDKFGDVHIKFLFLGALFMFGFMVCVIGVVWAYKQRKNNIIEFNGGSTRYIEGEYEAEISKNHEWNELIDENEDFEDISDESTDDMSQEF